MPTYLLNASACPALPVPTTGLQNPASGAPLVLNAIVLGETVNARPKLNGNAVSVEMLGRHGGGCYAIQTGMHLSIGSGLNVVVAAGQAVIDGPRTLAVNTNVLVPNTITNGTIWYTQAGALVASSNLTPPGGNVAFVGFYTSAGGVVTVVDESGVLRLDQGGGIPMRQTADIGCPGDAPPAGLHFLNKCVGGLWLWDGAGYQNLTNSGRAALTFASDANKTLLASEYSNRLLDFTSGGTTLTAQRNVVLPLTPAGRLWTLRNSSPGAQGLQAIGATGTGIVIATAKHAEISSDGTNIIRITPDT